MNEQWVRNALKSHIQGDILLLNNDGSMWIPIEDFVRMFISVTNPTYKNLRNALPLESGWPATFDKWHEEGLI